MSTNRHILKEGDIVTIADGYGLSEENLGKAGIIPNETRVTLGVPGLFDKFHIKEIDTHYVRAAIYAGYEGIDVKGITFIKEGKTLVPTVPHVHRDLIIQWAEGAVVQGKFGGLWVVITRPMWDPEDIYRVKPTAEELKAEEITRIRDSMEKLAEDLRKLEVPNENY